MRICYWGGAIAIGLLTGWVGSTQAAMAAVLVLNETFDDTSNFTTSTSLFSDGSADYLGLTGGSVEDFGGDSSPSRVKSYSGFDGGFLTGQDLDGEDADLPITFAWHGLNISGLTNLTFTGLFAESFEDPGDIDAADFIRLSYQIDNGGFQEFLWFSGADFSSNSGPSNGIFQQDTDFDGVGDGLALSDAAQTFSAAIAGTGSLLDLRFTVSLNAGDEDFAVDNFRVMGDRLPDPEPASVPEPGMLLGLAAIAATAIGRYRRR
jgi:hypothetical protein